MKLTLEVPDHEADFVLELLRRLTTVKVQAKRPAKPKAQDETAYLLSNEANAQELLESIEQIRRGQAVVRDLTD